MCIENEPPTIHADADSLRAKVAIETPITRAVSADSNDHAAARRVDWRAIDRPAAQGMPEVVARMKALARAFPNGRPPFTIEGRASVGLRTKIGRRANIKRRRVV